MTLFDKFYMYNMDISVDDDNNNLLVKFPSSSLTLSLSSQHSSRKLTFPNTVIYSQSVASSSGYTV